MEHFTTAGFTAYLALAVVLYAIREATGISNRFIPLTAIILGVSFAIFEYSRFDFSVLITGIKYALYGIGSVAAVKYFIENKNPSEK
jgi:hypothetical protein